ncbi:MAG: hypothetical protein ACREA8_03215 [Nitrosotalea sp.]
MSSLAVTVSIELMLKINNLLIRSLPVTNTSVNVNELSQTSGNLELALRRNEAGPFATLYVSVDEVDSSATIIFRIVAELEVSDAFDESKLKHLDIEEMMQKYADLKPAITESVTHKYDDTGDKNGRRASRSLRITFNVFDKYFEYNEETGFDYNTDEIAAQSVQYVKALYDIHRDIFSR